MRRIRILSAFYLLSAFACGASSGATGDDAMPESVSYYEHIRPLFQAKCQGCHQPAKAKGDYIMTEVVKLISGGENGAAVVPSKPDESYLIELVTKQAGADRPEMPPKEDPLTPYELAMVRKWIEQGAKDDTPSNARQRYDQQNPPQYAVPPVVTSLDFSPDGKLIAVAGFHEVLLHRADGSGLEARLVGLSERIESARFSPDGKRLAVAGGLPGRMGEIQVWDVEKRELKLSKPVGYDTAYGASWSPDGKHIAFGLPDNTVRAIDAETGNQTLFMGSHSDWVLDTVWSIKGDHIVSVARDMSAKLTNVPTERFVDNVTSITPGALKGGMNAVVRHPKTDHILVGGSDGVPQIYRMYRETARKIGDNANLIRKYPAMSGRIWSVAFAPDGKRFAAVSSLNGQGMVNFYKSEYDATISPELKKAFETADRRGVGPDDIVEKFQTQGAELLKSVKIDGAAVFSVAFSPDGKTVAAGADDGQIRLIDADSASVKLTFAPVQITDVKALADNAAGLSKNPVNLKKGKANARPDELPKGRQVVGIEISPATVVLDSPGAYNQLLVTAKFDTGESADLTRQVTWALDKPVAAVEGRGVARPKGEGDATLTATYEGKTATAKVKVSGLNAAFHPDFLRDVNPVITRLGCNAGTCHGAKDGKNGFKLSLRGYDPVYDVRAFGDDHAARRVNYSSPDDSLMLLKATGAVPHEAGSLTDIGSAYYNTIRQWIADGANLKSDTPRVTRIELFPKNPVIQNTAGRQQLRVVAHFADGKQRDVTHEAFIESGNGEVAEHDDFGLMTTIRRGEAPILARYEGAYAATTLTVMGDREGFTWQQPETWGEIDKLVASKWERMKVLPSGVCSDEEFIRRVYLDLTGLPPSSDRVGSFLADKRPIREKRDAVVDQLIGSPEFVDHWANKWADMLQVNSKFLGGEGAKLFREWIRKQVEANTPYDQFVYSIVTASGSNKENPAASYFKILRNPEDLVENTTHLFLATRFNCNKCHDHPFEKWNVANYYDTASYFAQVGLARDGKNAPNQNIGGTAVEGAKPLYEVIADKAEGDVTNIVTNQTAKPAFPYPAKVEKAAFANPQAPTRREQLGAWMTSPDNRYFGMSYANRIWGYLTGTGLIEPIDDIRAGNPPSNPELMDYLTRQFVGGGFDVRKLMAEICKSRTYQLSIEANQWNADDTINFAKAKARRLPAEVLFDAVYAVTGSIPNIPGAGPGVRAAQLADSQTDAKGGFLANLGRPPRESACECDRQNDLQLGSVMSLLSGPAVAEAIGDPKNAIAALVASEPDDKKLIEKLYLRVLNRKPTAAEIATVLENWSGIENDHTLLVAKLAQSEGAWVPKKAELEKLRLQAIAKANGDIATYQPEFNKKKAEAEAAKRARIAAADKALKEYTAQLPAKVAEWEKSITVDRLWTLWNRLTPASVAVTGSDITAKVQADGTVLGAGSSGNADYVVTIPIPKGAPTTITGFMLETLPDDALAGFGPGLNGNGNFVVTEFQAEVLTGTDPKAKPVPVKFTAAMADHNQNDFDVKNAINGVVDRNDKGWAVAGQERRPHWARFQLEKPIQIDDKGATLTVKVLCRYSNGEYPLGKFRILATDSPQPLDLGLLRDVSAIAAMAPGKRSEAQKAALLGYVGEQDVELLKRRQLLVQENRPLPADPKMEELKAALVRTELPVIDDPVLISLRGDVGQSIQQAANRRLTGAQDLTWALINNAAFLFNR
jgi:WD40 repeat protein